jgi:hypothetical protein
MTNTNAGEENFRYLKIELKYCIPLSVLLCLIWIILWSLPIILFHVYAQQQVCVARSCKDRLLFPLMHDLCIINFYTLLQPVKLNNIVDPSFYKYRDLIGQE